MQELLDRIRERNFQKTIELRSYSGNKAYDYKLLAAGIGVYSLYVNNQDFGVTLYDFNDIKKRSMEVDHNGKPDRTKELDHIITEMIRVKLN